VDGSAISSTEVVVGSFFAPAWVHAEDGTRVGQELRFTGPIRNEEAACFC
jgi:hypothetical protein